MNFAVIIPCYNEQYRLDWTSFSTFLRTHSNFTFIFVDDGSTDQTYQLLEKFRQQHLEVQVLKLDKNRGKAEAVRLGMMTVMNNTHFDYLSFLDADLSTPLDELLRLATKLERRPVQCLMGTRFLHLGARIERRMLRHYLGRIFATAVSIMLKLPVYDTQCGCKFFERGIAQLIFKDPFVSPWFFDVECLFRLKNFGDLKQTVEVPLHQWVHCSGSKLKWYDFLKTPWELLKIYRHYR